MPAELDLYLFTIHGKDLLGWIATAILASSFFFKETILKCIQILSASVWIFYGFIIDSKPVIIANCIVIIAVLLSFFIRYLSTRSAVQRDGSKKG